jgi:hypothetical protein
MSRAALVALASLVATAASCGPAPAPLTQVVVYWEFDRHTWIDGVAGTVRYDAAVNWPPGTGSRNCPEAGVDFVTVADGNGNPLTGNVPCVNQAVQGVVLSGFPGANTYWVTGWRSGVAAPLYRGSVTINVVNGQPTFDTAIAAGIPSDLTVSAILGGVTFPFCGNAGVNELDGWVQDGAGTLVWRDFVTCGLQDPPGISFGPVDRDDLSLWMDAVGPSGGSQAILFSRCRFQFPHLMTGENWFSLNLPTGVCTPDPPVASPVQ